MHVSIHKRFVDARTDLVNAQECWDDLTRDERLAYLNRVTLTIEELQELA